MMPLPNPIRTRSNSMRVGGNGWVGSVAALGCLAVVIGILVRLPGSSYEAKGFQTQSPIVFRDVAAAAGLTPKFICGTPKKEFILEVSGSGLVWFDFNNDGYLDLFGCGYVDFDIHHPPSPTELSCTVRGKPVKACGPRGLKGAPDFLYHNNGDGTFSDVTDRAGVSDQKKYYGFSALIEDLDGDTFPDIIVT